MRKSFEIRLFTGKLEPIKWIENLAAEDKRATGKLEVNDSDI